MPDNLLIIAGEPSGDALGGPLAEEIHRIKPNLELWGYGGEKMRAAGVEILSEVEELAVMGFVDVLGRLPEMFRRLRDLSAEAVTRKVDGAVLIDYPGFNIRLAERLAKRGIPVVYYVSPQVWAWKPGRVHRLAKSVSRMLTILPFEEEIYRQTSLPVTFVGHYFLDTISPKASPAEFRAELGLDEPLLLLLPGSRKQEVSRLLDPMLGAFNILSGRIENLHGLIIKAPGLPDGLFDFPENPRLKIVEDNAIDAMFASTAAICCSGSATLQCALAELPHAITYLTDTISAAIYRRFIKTPYIGLSNLVAGREISQELLQSDATAENLASAIEPFLTDSAARRDKVVDLGEIRAKLGQPGASRRAAGAVISEIYG